MKRVLILGSSGFIGKNLVNYFSTKYEIDAPTSKEVNVLDDGAIERYIKAHAYDVILNALDRRSDISSPSLASIYVSERLRMFVNLARLSDYDGKMLYFGSGAEYDRSLPIKSIREDQFDRSIPKDAYGFLMYTMQLLAFQKKNITNFRLFGIFGSHEDYRRRFISNAICKALCGFPITIRQNAIFDYLHTEDLCEMVEFYIENHLKYRAYNATSGKRYELVFLAKLVQEVLGVDIPILIAKSGLKDEYSSCNALITKENSLFQFGSISNQIKILANYYRSLRDGEQIDREALLYWGELG